MEIYTALQFLNFYKTFWFYADHREIKEETEKIETVAKKSKKKKKMKGWWLLTFLLLYKNQIRQEFVFSFYEKIIKNHVLVVYSLASITRIKDYTN